MGWTIHLGCIFLHLTCCFLLCSFLHRYQQNKEKIQVLQQTDYKFNSCLYPEPAYFIHYKSCTVSEHEYSTVTPSSLVKCKQETYLTDTSKIAIQELEALGGRWLFPFCKQTQTLCLIIPKEVNIQLLCFVLQNRNSMRGKKQTKKKA